jgi:hypothetical protein
MGISKNGDVAKGYNSQTGDTKYVVISEIGGARIELNKGYM